MIAIIFPPADAPERRPGVMPAAEDLAARWNSSLRPVDAYEVWLVEQVAVEAVRIDACRHRDSALRDANARRAGDDDAWDLDRKAEAEVLGRGLARNPSLVMAQLRRTKHGCQFLAERWAALKSLAERKVAWNAARRSLAMDLLGVPPILREGLDPLGVEGLEGDALAEAQRLLAIRELDRLAHHIEHGLARRDREERDMTRAGIPPAPIKEMEQARRQEAACQRRLNWALAQLKRKGKSTGAGVGSASKSTKTASAVDARTTASSPLDTARSSFATAGPEPGGRREVSQSNGNRLAGSAV